MKASKEGELDFKKIFLAFADHQKQLKVISVATCSRDCHPNSASKMLVDVVSPNTIYFLDYKFTQTYSNLQVNPIASISFMDDDSFTGYRLTGHCEVLHEGREYEKVQKSWEKRLITYEADRILKRVTGQYSTREAENFLPRDFMVIKFHAEEACTIKPDRVFRAFRGMNPEA